MERNKCKKKFVCGVETRGENGKISMEMVKKD